MKAAWQIPVLSALCLVLATILTVVKALDYFGSRPRGKAVVKSAKTLEGKRATGQGIQLDSWAGQV